MKTWNGGITPLFFTSALDGCEWSASRPGRFTSGERSPVPIGEEAGWAPEPVWTLYNTEKTLAPIGNRILAIQPVAKQTELSWLL
jgi:hypothetical protein